MVKKPATIVFIPLDDRPCCLQFVKRLAAFAGCEIMVPDRSMLGGLNDPGHVRALINWTSSALEDRPEAAVVAALDMIAFGGLVASRDPGPSGPSVLQLYEFLSMTAIKKLYAFLTVMRAAPTQKSVADVLQALTLTEISQKMGELLVRLADHTLESAYESEKEIFSGRISLSSEDRQVLSKTLKLLPAEVVGEYLSKRSRKQKLNLLALNCWTNYANENWDKASFLALGLDDCTTRGLNIFEAKQLQYYIEAKNLHAAMSAGTDELAMLMLARACGSVSPIAVVWGRPGDANNITRYEDRPLEQLVASQAKLANISLVKNPESLTSSLKRLFVFGPGRYEQAEAVAQDTQPAEALARLAGADGRPGAGFVGEEADKLLESLYQDEELESFLDELSEAAENGSDIAVADVCFANGASCAMTAALILSGLISQVDVYAAWNTAGNTVGTCLSALALLSTKREERSNSEEMARTEFLIERLLDDFFYQSYYRSVLCRKCEGTFVQLTDSEVAANVAFLSARLRIIAEELCRSLFNEYELDNLTVFFPWNRLFEIEIAVELRSVISGEAES